MYYFCITSVLQMKKLRTKKVLNYLVNKVYSTRHYIQQASNSWKQVLLISIIHVLFMHSYIYMEKKRDTHNKKISHSVMDTEKSSVCNQQTEVPGKPTEQFQFDFKCLSPVRVKSLSFSSSLNPKPGEDQHPTLEIVRRRYQILSYSALYSIHAFSGLNVVYSH